MRRLLIFGAGQTGEVAHFYFTHDSDHEVVAFVADGARIERSTVLGLPVVPFEEVGQHYPPDQAQMFVALSFVGLNHPRAEKLAEVAARGYRSPSYVSSRATTWPGLTVGPNCFVLEDNTIQPYVRIGKNVTLWSGNHVGHHSAIGDHCFVASHAVISGAVSIGEYTFVGVNATIRDNVRVGRENVVGSGALILADTEDFQVFRGAQTKASRVPSNRLRGI